MPIEVAQYVRGLVRRGVTLPVLLRSYRLGHAWFWDRWSQALRDRIERLEDLLAAQEQSSAFMFADVDRISGILVEDYGSEREAAAALGPGEPLVLPSGVASLDGWCGSYEPPTAAALEGYVTPDGRALRSAGPAGTSPDSAGLMPRPCTPRAWRHSPAIRLRR